MTRVVRAAHNGPIAERGRQNFLRDKDGKRVNQALGIGMIDVFEVREGLELVERSCIEDITPESVW